MQAFFASLREFSFVSMLARLLLALLAGGMIGFGRTRRAHPAGLRTYMLISIGAAMSVLLTLYLYHMLNGPWAGITEEVGLRFDASRLAAQVVAGIGFLGAGIIIKVSHQQVSGLTTATGLFATVCMSLAAGAGFYEMVLMAAVLITLVMNVMTPLEIAFKRRLRNITLTVEFSSVEDIHAITAVIERMNAQIVDIDIERAKKKKGDYPSAVFTLKLSRENHSHSSMLSSLAELPGVRSVQELIS